MDNVPRMPSRYLTMYFEETELQPTTYRVKSPAGVPHQIPTEVVLEHIAQTSGRELKQIEDIIRKIDYANGDLHDFLEHLAKAIAHGYEDDGGMMHRGSQDLRNQLVKLAYENKEIRSKLMPIIAHGFDVGFDDDYDFEGGRGYAGDPNRGPDMDALLEPYMRGVKSLKRTYGRNGKFTHDHDVDADEGGMMLFLSVQLTLDKPVAPDQRSWDALEKELKKHFRNLPNIELNAESGDASYGPTKDISLYIPVA